MEGDLHACPEHWAMLPGPAVLNQSRMSIAIRPGLKKFFACFAVHQMLWRHQIDTFYMCARNWCGT